MGLRLEVLDPSGVGTFLFVYLVDTRTCQTCHLERLLGLHDNAVCKNRALSTCIPNNKAQRLPQRFSTVVALMLSNVSAAQCINICTCVTWLASWDYEGGVQTSVR